MYLNHILYALASAAVINANPDAGDSWIDATTNGILMCKETGFTGECIHFKTKMNQCLNFNDQWKNSVSSFSPDRPTAPLMNYNCTVFAAAGCVGKTITLAYPGAQDMNQGGPIMSKENESWTCRYLDTYVADAVAQGFP